MVVSRGMGIWSIYPHALYSHHNCHQLLCFKFHPYRFNTFFALDLFLAFNIRIRRTRRARCSLNNKCSVAEILS